MLVMSLSGAVISIGRPGVEVNLPAGLVTAYLVLTGFLTVQPPSSRIRSVERGAMFASIGLGVMAIVLGSAVIRRGYGGFAALGVHVRCDCVCWPGRAIAGCCARVV